MAAEQQFDVTDASGRTLSGLGESDADLRAVVESAGPSEIPESEPAESTSEPGTAQESVPAATPEPPAELQRWRNADGTYRKPPRGPERVKYFEWQAGEAERRSSAAEQKAADLQAKLEAAERRAAELDRRPSGSPQAAPPPPAAPQVQQADRITARQEQAGVEPTRPQPSEDEIGSKYRTYAEFVADTARWVWEQSNTDVDARIQQAIASDRAQQRFFQGVEATWEKGRAAYPDFDSVIRSAAVVFPGPILEAIADAPHSEHVQYRLAKDPALSQQLAAETNPIRVGMLLASLAGTPAASSAPARVPTSTPPPPMQPVGSGAKTAGPSFADLSAAGAGDVSDQMADYRRLRDRERSAGGRR